MSKSKCLQIKLYVIFYKKSFSTRINNKVTFYLKSDV